VASAAAAPAVAAAPPAGGDAAPEPVGAALPRARQHLVALAVLALVTVAFFAPYLFQGKVFIAADALKQYLPWSASAPQGFRAKNTLITDPVNANWAGLYNEQLKSGGLQHWNPWLLTGLPSTGVTAMSGGAPGRYYPLKLLLHRVLPPVHAFMWLLILHVFLAGAFQYFFLREVGAGPAGALFGGVAFMLNGYAMVWLEFESVAAVAAWLPLLLLLMERYRRRPLRYSLLGALALGTVALSGQIQYLIYLALLLLAYQGFLLARSWRERRDPRQLGVLLAAFAGTCALGALLGAVELLPSLDLIRHSSRIARTFTFGTFFETLGRVPWRYFTTLLFPDFFGSPPLGFNLVPRLPTQEYMNYNELCLYLGVPTLFALLAAPLAWRRPHAAFSLGLIAFVTLLLAGTFLYYPFFALFPGMDRMNPTRLIFLFVFAAATAAGLGFDALETLAGRRRAALTALAGALAAGAAGLALAAGSSRSLAVFMNAEFFQRQSNPAAIGTLLRLRAFTADGVVLKPVLLAAAAAALVIAFVWVRRRAARAALAAALVALLAYDLGSFGRGYNAIVEPQLLYPRTPGIDFLLRQPQPFRVVLDGRAPFLVNTFAPFGIQEVGGYSSFYPEGAGRFLSFVEYGEGALRGMRFDRWVVIGNAQSPLLELANARFLVTAPWARVADPRYRQVFRQEIAIYEDTRALPRAFAVHRARAIADGAQALRYLGSPAFEPAAEVVLEREPDAAFLAGVRPAADRVAVERYAPDRVEVSAQLGAAGWVVLGDAWDPGWRAEVDGRPAAVERADVAFRAVALPAGSHRVVFTYVARAFRAGLAISLAALALVAGGLAWERRRPGA
jgi:hypothetical protein